MADDVSVKRIGAELERFTVENMTTLQRLCQSQNEHIAIKALAIYFELCFDKPGAFFVSDA